MTVETNKNEPTGMGYDEFFSVMPTVLTDVAESLQKFMEYCEAANTRYRETCIGAEPPFNRLIYDSQEQKVWLRVVSSGTHDRHTYILLADFNNSTPPES